MTRTSSKRLTLQPPLGQELGGRRWEGRVVIGGLVLCAGAGRVAYEMK